MAAFETKVRGGLVAVESVGVVDDVLVEGDHAGEIVRVVGGLFGRDGVGEPVEAPLDGADDSVGVAGCEGSLPGEHPLRVKP